MADSDHIIEDITNYKETEEDLMKTRERLLESGQRFQDINERSNTGIFNFNTMTTFCKGKI